MSLIYSLGDRVLVAGVASRSSNGAMTALYSDNRSPSGFRIVEAVVSGISANENVTGDSPARNAVMFLQYSGADGAVRNLDYGLWMVSEGNFGTRIRRTLDRIEGLTPEQRELLMFYSYPRVLASVAYTHMLRDLASLVTPNAEAPRIVITDRDVVFAHAAELNIPTYPYDMYRGLSATVEEPDMDSDGATPVIEDFGRIEPYPVVSMPTRGATGMNSARAVSSDPRPTWDFLSNIPPVDQASQSTEPAEIGPADDSDEDDDSWMNDDPVDEDDNV